MPASIGLSSAATAFTSAPGDTLTSVTTCWVSSSAPVRSSTRAAGSGVSVLYDSGPVVKTWRDGRRLPADLPVVAVLARRCRCVVYVHWLRPSLPNFHVAFSANVAPLSLRSIAPTSTCSVLAEAVEQLAERVGRLRRIGRQGGGRRRVVLVERVGERVHRGVQPILGVAPQPANKDERRRTAQPASQWRKRDSRARRADLPWQREHQRLVGRRDRLHHVIAVLGQPLEHTAHQHLGHRRAGRDADRRHPLEPGRVDVVGVVDQIGGLASPRRARPRPAAPSSTSCATRPRSPARTPAPSP